MSWVRASDDEVRQRLTSELARVEDGDPHDVFSLAPDARADQIRAAYLAATKVYHPNRFARRNQTIRRLANELFLIINRSYQQLTAPPSTTRGSQLLRNTTKKDAVVTGAPRATRASQVPPVSTTVAFKPAHPTPTPTPTPAPASRPAPPSRPPGQPLIPDPPSQAAGSTPTTDRSRRTTDGRALAPGRAGLERTLDQRRRARDRKGTPIAAVPSAPPSRAPTPPPAVPASDVVDRVVEREDKRNEQFKSGQMMLRQGKFSAAKEVFRQLAIESPSTKKFRVYMHYAWGRELQAARRDDDARAEYNRALNLEPDFEPALKSVASLAAETPKPPTGGGILSRFFPKS